MFSLYINNTPEQNKVINNKASSVKISLTTPIELDPKKKWQLRVLQSNIFFCQPNITTKNNKFSYEYNGTTHNKTIPIGLYGIDEINDTIARITTFQNGSQLFAFVPNPATSTTILCFSKATCVINLSTDSIMASLGFPTSGDISGVPANGSVESTSPSQLNSLQLILVKCNITNGSYLNADQSNIICGIPITVESPYEQIQYNPIHPTRNMIFVDRIDNIQVDLLDQDGNPLDMTMEGTYPAESWNLTLDVSEYDTKKLL